MERNFSECSKCGAAVIDASRHRRLHSDLDDHERDINDLERKVRDLESEIRRLK